MANNPDAFSVTILYRKGGVSKVLHSVADWRGPKLSVGDELDFCEIAPVSDDEPRYGTVKRIVHRFDGLSRICNTDVWIEPKAGEYNLAAAL